MADELPTAEEIAAARELLTRAASTGADAARAALIAFVTMPEFGAVVEAGRAAAALNPANVDLGYVLTMMERVRAANAPA